MPRNGTSYGKVTPLVKRDRNVSQHFKKDDQKGTRTVERFATSTDSLGRDKPTTI